MTHITHATYSQIICATHRWHTPSGAQRLEERPIDLVVLSSKGQRPKMHCTIGAAPILWGICLPPPTCLRELRRLHPTTDFMPNFLFPGNSHSSSARAVALSNFDIKSRCALPAAFLRAGQREDSRIQIDPKTGQILHLRLIRLLTLLPLPHLFLFIQSEQ